ncbi:hypothetical protein HanIR_Chr14g0683251 [Helianthus annuus]|nr:hypothetical protein HanIR_Chr14g0683251 [Helianthus annuus]
MLSQIPHDSKPYPAKHKIPPLNMCGVTAYHLLNPLEEPHRGRERQRYRKRTGQTRADLL